MLWLVYLMPTWLRRRQYLATERNAVRLQQTLRILAETAEVPAEVRAEVHARSVAEQHRALRQAAQRAEAVARAREAAAARALARSARAPREPKQKAAAVSALATSRLRRSRLLSAFVLAASVAGVGFGVVEVITNGSWLLVAASSVGVLGSLGMLQRIATVAAARRASQAVDRTVAVAPPVQSFVDWERREEERPTWTPVPLPKPLYLSRREVTEEPMPVPAVRRIEVTVDESLKIAAAKAQEALRAAQSAPEVTQLPQRPAAKDRAASWAAMGLLDDASPGITDLNDVLRRRRAV
ncbi:hypothetical protein [Naasia aerilata]|uniref:Large exoprotein n=1 Tax=Naasia aerilata TaxID=1162966 RepID=A0ABM8G9A2_9MICO|nr:hypothetical protein [Naasia aerilata]BDZ44777.1 hypothetical protein GCM10025866_06860 [Naasia aerilata]